MDMKDRVVLVTGAGNGSGTAIALKFLSEGAIVAAGDIREPSWDAGIYEDRLLRLAFDVSDEAAVNSAVEMVNSQTDGISVLVNNAGIAPEANIQDLEMDMWEKIFAVNTRGTFLCTRAVVKHMLVNGIKGSIVNISSIAGRNAFPGSSAYCASKAGVIGFTRSLAVELGPKDIRVNAVCPGSVDTAMIQGVIQNISKGTGMDIEAVRRMMEDSIPLNRFQTPEDVADMVYFLASDASRNVTGETINLDGGAVRN